MRWLTSTLSVAARTSRCGAELFGGLVAEEFHAVPALDEGLSLRREALQFDRADFRAVLFLLAAPLRLLVVVEFPLDPADGAVEGVDGRPEQVLEVGFEAGVAKASDCSTSAPLRQREVFK